MLRAAEHVIDECDALLRTFISNPQSVPIDVLPSYTMVMPGAIVSKMVHFHLMSALNDSMFPTAWASYLPFCLLGLGEILHVSG